MSEEAKSEVYRVLYTKLSIYDRYLKLIDILSGECIGGNYSLSADSAIRRTCSIEMIVKDKFLPSQDSPFWVNKRFKLEVGVENEQGLNWYSLGVYAILNVNVNNTTNDSNLTISGGDLACELNGDISGELLINQEILVEDKRENIGDLIKGIIVDVLGYDNVLIEKSEYVLPYDIKKDAGETWWDIIDELTKLYYNYESFFDSSGQFVFQKKSTNYYDPVVWDSRAENGLISINRSLDYANVKNKFVVYGKLDDDNTQYKYELEVRDSNYPNNPFTIEKLDEQNPRAIYESKEKYTSNDQCREYAEYLAMIHTNCADKAEVTCLPLYFLEVNDVIYLHDEESKTDGKYAIDTINCGLGHEATMSIGTHKIYDSVVL